MKILHSLLLIAFLYSCSSTPYVPTGEYQWFSIDGHFKTKKNDDEIQAILRKTNLQCRNEMLQIKIPGRGAIPDSDGSLGQEITRNAAIIDSRDGEKQARRDRREYFNNCMELNGFESKWVKFEVVSD